ncbi:thioredoxin family protein [Snuella sedimenti]|uniref:Thioredoxin family protein n=1 Tax=Snuella sedimenti TaxID=2798802 RepID=A0A8J7III2_9FLAO|nr:thioredoxin family protein [Snuella sedimenti]MBJ6369678.1 thioredoxin family protein [Snuella sedimenti]
MKTLIKESLQCSMSYKEYRDLVAKLVAENGTTGSEKTEERIDFTKLNDRRMKRWDKTINISEDIQDKIMGFDHQVTWLVIVESWCGDGAHMLPALDKIASLNDRIDLRVVLRDDNPKLMNAFLTDGAQAIPKLIMIDDETEAVLSTYGPRPTEATNYVSRFKNMYGKLTPEFKKDLQHWYNNNKGQNIIEDVTEMLCHFEPNVCQ